MSAVYCNVKALDFDNQIQSNKLKKECRDGWEILEPPFGAESLYSLVYRTCCGRDCAYVAKIQKDMDKSYKEHMLMNDCTQQKKGLCIKLLDSFSDTKLGCSVLIMYALDISAKDIFKLELVDTFIKRTIFNRVIQMLKSLHEIGIYHGDPHLENVMAFMKNKDEWETPYDIDTYYRTDFEWKFIDLGEGGWLDKEPDGYQKRIEDFTILFQDLHHIADDTNSKTRELIQTEFFPIIKKIIEDIRNTKKELTAKDMSPISQLRSFYSKHNPSRLDEENITKVLGKYKGREDELFEKLADKYDVPNPYVNEERSNFRTRRNKKIKKRSRFPVDGEEIQEEIGDSDCAGDKDKILDEVLRLAPGCDGKEDPIMMDKIEEGEGVCFE